MYGPIKVVCTLIDYNYCNSFFVRFFIEKCGDKLGLPGIRYCTML